MATMSISHATSQPSVPNAICKSDKSQTLGAIAFFHLANLVGLAAVSGAIWLS